MFIHSFKYYSRFEKGKFVSVLLILLYKQNI